MKDLISFLFMCVLTLAGAEKKKIAVPRCSEAAVAYILQKLRRKTAADKTNFLIEYSTASLINLSCFIDKKTLDSILGRLEYFTVAVSVLLQRVFFKSGSGPITPIFNFTNIFS